MKYLKEVSSEGGPLLISDAALARQWRGMDGDERSDYARACRLFDPDEPPGGLLPLGSGHVMIWEMEGAGTADVFAPGSGRLIIIRSWLDGMAPAEEFKTIENLAGMPVKVFTDLGVLTINSGVLAILWAPESGECIQSLDVPEDGRPTGEMCSESSGLLVGLPAGCYSCLHDFVRIGDNEARRCHILGE